MRSSYDKRCSLGYKVMLLTGRKDEGTYRFYESAGFDRYSKQAFLAKLPKAEQGGAVDALTCVTDL
jgi:hypothetical protein